MTEPRFTGDARLAPVGQLAGPVKVSVVSFADGGRTYWHSHDGGQILHVTEGSGSYQERGGEVEDIAAGDSVSAEPGVEHWHGAAPGTTMTHVAVSGGTTRWLDPA